MMSDAILRMNTNTTWNKENILIEKEIEADVLGRYLLYGVPWYKILLQQIVYRMDLYDGPDSIKNSFKSLLPAYPDTGVSSV